MSVSSSSALLKQVRDPHAAFTSPAGASAVQTERVAPEGLYVQALWPASASTERLACAGDFRPKSEKALTAAGAGPRVSRNSWLSKT